MQITRTMLNHYLQSSLASAALAEKLSMAGIETRATSLSQIPSSVVVARLDKRDKHPNADRLNCCSVFDGTTHFAIVCGANNMQAGDLVALAKIDSVLPGGLTIKKSKIRGETSEGMLCSPSELGLSGEAEGILILPKHHRLGQPLLEALGLNDDLFTLEVTPNRGDCLSVLGVARELSALGAGTFIATAKASEALPKAELKPSLEITLQANEAAPNYYGMEVKLPQSVPSPAWLQQRLQQCGMRSLHLLVDLTNYIMLEMGQPLHAFDVAHLQGQKLLVRFAKSGETLLALDDKTYDLISSDLVIADAKQPQCLAGVMGGKGSGVTPNTQHCFIEAATFASASVRATSKRLHLSSESSYRFERHVDPKLPQQALARLQSLLREITAAQFSPILGHGQLMPAAAIELHPEVYQRLIGMPLDLGLAKQQLQALGCEVQAKAAHLHVIPPSHRPDLQQPVDLIEECVRLTGYEKIPTQLHGAASTPDLASNSLELAWQLGDYLVGQGFYETKHLSFTTNEWVALSGQRAVKLDNPLSQPQAWLRPQLLPSLIDNLASNLQQFRHYPQLRLFEANQVYALADTTTAAAVVETPHLAAIAWQRSLPPWQAELGELNFFKFKAILQGLLKIAGISNVKFTHDINNTLPFFHPRIRSNVMVDNISIGGVGQLHPQHLRGDISEPVLAFEIDLSALLAPRRASRYVEFSRYPTVQRDLAFVMDEEKVTAQDALQLIEKHAGALLQQVELIDCYRGQPLPAGKKSLAFRLHFQAMDRTLQEQEVDVAKIIERFCAQFKAELRS